MDKTKERRKEKRLHYQLPVWFAENPDKTASEAVMVDISSRGMAFNCKSDENCPSQGQQLTTRFNLPRSGTDYSDTESYTRTGHVCHIEHISNNLCRVAIQFDEPPPFWDTPPAK